MYAIMAEVSSWFFAIVLIRHGHPGQAFLAIFGLPVLYGVIGFIMIAISCWVYNHVARRIGGIAFELAPHSQN
jgi:hypothetical protein